MTTEFIIFVVAVATLCAVVFIGGMILDDITTIQNNIIAEIKKLQKDKP